MNIQSTNLIDTAFQKGVAYQEAISTLYGIPVCKGYLKKDKPEFKDAVIACLKAGFEANELRELVVEKVTSSPKLGAIKNFSKKIDRFYKGYQELFNTNQSLSSDDKQKLKQDLEEKVKSLDKSYVTVKTEYAIQYARFRETKKCAPKKPKDGFFPFIKKLDLASLEQLKARCIKAGYTEKDKDGKETNKVMRKVEHAIRKKTEAAA